MPSLNSLRTLVTAGAFSMCASTGFAQPAATDEAAIRAVRARYNAAIAAHDVAAMAEAWLPNYVSISSRNARDVGRDAAREGFANTITSRPDVVFVRTPASITINREWLQAAESGSWTGTWKAADGAVRVGGIYFAKWLRVNSDWKILSETFVQTTCSGGNYCTTPPPAT